MIAAKYPTKRDLKNAKGTKLAYQKSSDDSPDFNPNGPNEVVGPTLNNKKYKATVFCNDGLIENVE